MQIIPTLLEKSSESFIQNFNKLSPFFHYFQIDIADGEFVPNKTITTQEVLTTIKQLNNRPMKQYIFDFHLMVKDYKKELEVISEISTLTTVKHILVHTSTIRENSFAHSRAPYTCGLVLDPTDDVLSVQKRFKLETIPVIQIMSVKPGFQGSPFLKETLLKIEQLRNADYRYIIFLDGGVNDKTLRDVVSQRYQPDAVCVGSYLTLEKDPKNHIAQLKELMPK